MLRESSIFFHDIVNLKKYMDDNSKPYFIKVTVAEKK
jgi:hypothetical protein